MLKRYRVKCSECIKYPSTARSATEIVLGKRGIAYFKILHNIKGTVKATVLKGKVNAKKS